MHLTQIERGSAAKRAKHGIMLGDYVANRVVGKDKQPELAATFGNLQAEGSVVLDGCACHAAARLASREPV